MLGVDVGGTFTDVVGIQDGNIVVTKIPSNREQPEKSVIHGVDVIGAEGKTTFNHASTVGLNSVITRQLDKVAFLTSEGHRDILDFGRVWRQADQTGNKNWRRSFGDASSPLVPRYLRRGIRERILADGTVYIPLDEAQARLELEVLRKCNVKGVAICLLNAYRNPIHELRLAEMVAEILGEIPCSISSQVSPLAQEYPRASTTLIDVFMSNVYSQYSSDLVDGLTDIGYRGTVNFADSAATLMPTDYALKHPARLVFSGPAAGTNSCSYFGSLIDETEILCCDVGGTSADISLVTGGTPFVKTTFELEHDLVINALSSDVISLGAGGGSIVRANSVGEISVGPGSAGGDPGPACYGRGGSEPTVTDACLLIGILDSQEPLGGEIQLDGTLAGDAFRQLDLPYGLSDRIGNAYRMTLNNLAEGLFGILLGRGLDPRDFSLMAYGSAGPMLLPALLGMLNIRRVIVPPHPGLFSALGLLSSELVYSANVSSYEVLREDIAPVIDQVYEKMEKELLDQIGMGRDRVRIERTMDARLVGQAAETPLIAVPNGTIDSKSIHQISANFHSRYRQVHGNSFEQLDVEGVVYRVRMSVPTEMVSYPRISECESETPKAYDTIRLRHLEDDEGPICSVFAREELRAGHLIKGPAIVREALSTTHLLDGQEARVGEFGELVIERA